MRVNLRFVPCTIVGPIFYLPLHHNSIFYCCWVSASEQTGARSACVRVCECAPAPNSLTMNFCLQFCLCNIFPLYICVRRCVCICILYTRTYVRSQRSSRCVYMRVYHNHSFFLSLSLRVSHWFARRAWTGDECVMNVNAKMFVMKLKCLHQVDMIHK